MNLSVWGVYYPDQVDPFICQSIRNWLILKTCHPVNVYFMPRGWEITFIVDLHSIFSCCCFFRYFCFIRYFCFLRYFCRHFNRKRTIFIRFLSAIDGTLTNTTAPSQSKCRVGVIAIKVVPHISQSVYTGWLKMLTLLWEFVYPYFK